MNGGLVAIEQDIQQPVVLEGSECMNPPFILSC